jgi:nitroimidazol reductase NimA-like FMN-containing flavoprotein (pyridoxamine 5'-phosphate oxidase superfamily)
LRRAITQQETAMEHFPVSALNKVRRSDRANYDREAIHAVLDEGMLAHVGFMDEERPVVVPMVYGRIRERLYIHGAKAARFAKTMASGVPVCITVTLLDALVIGRSAFHNSMNYRSVVIHGLARKVEIVEEAEEALIAITDHLLPGRWDESRPMTAKELRSTSVLRVEVEAASLKSRSGLNIDEDEDYGLPLWGGVIPVRPMAKPPQDDGLVPPGVKVPASIEAFQKRFGGS